MSVLTYPPVNEENIFKSCTKECGIITSTEDQQYFALGCSLCPEKFLYFDAFIGHIQTIHLVKSENMDKVPFDDLTNDEVEDLTDADPALLEPEMEIRDESSQDEENEEDNDDCIEIPEETDISSDLAAFCGEAITGMDVSLHSDDQNLLNDSFGSFDLLSNDLDDDDDDSNSNDLDNLEIDDEQEVNYDDLVEESLLGDANSGGVMMHIKDKKMIQYLIDCYRRNIFLWDHRHPQFRDRAKRANFICWMNTEFKRRFNVVLAKDAVTRKWDNLRTVYKREINRMCLEKTNISSLWYFNELKFLNKHYNRNTKPIDNAVIKDPMFRRRPSNLWNDASTCQMLSLLQRYPCFYDKFDPYYRSREKRGEALQEMALELSKTFDVTTVQLSKRISQLRFDYSRQKQDRFQCEANNKKFFSSFTYYDQMFFMDVDIAPYKCEICRQILQTSREMEMHLLNHPQDTSFFCNVCHIFLPNAEHLKRHDDIHMTGVSIPKDVKFNCDLCTAIFREKSKYDDHMREHNDELLLPALEPLSQSPTNINNSFTLEKPFICDICDRSYASQLQLAVHREKHERDREKRFKCEFPQCGRLFATRQNMLEHVRHHYNDEEHRCEICGKTFKSAKNLQNHKQIHDAVKRYICKICGSAFAQAAGLYLHKRRHNRQEPRSAV